MAARSNFVHILSNNIAESAAIRSNREFANPDTRRTARIRSMKCTETA
jgi:hypothetical protein